MADYMTTLSLNGAYSLDATLLKDVVHRAEKFLADEVTIQFKFANVHRLESTSLKDILEDSLLRTDNLTEITAQGSNYRVDPARRFEFKARGEVPFATIQIEVAGTQDECRSLISFLEPLLRAKRQWYSPIILTMSPVSVVTALLSGSSY
jgi:hypothetical protein